MLTDIFFDLDNTILDFDRAERTALSRALTELLLPAGEDVLRRYHIINQDPAGGAGGTVRRPAAGAGFRPRPADSLPQV